MQVRELDMATLRWRRVEAGGTPPPFRIHCWCMRPPRPAGDWHRWVAMLTLDWPALASYQLTSDSLLLARSAAVVGDKWIVHGGRRPGKFNVTNQTFVFSFATLRCINAAFSLTSKLCRQPHSPSTGCGSLRRWPPPRPRICQAAANGHPSPCSHRKGVQPTSI